VNGSNYFSAARDQTPDLRAQLAISAIVLLSSSFLLFAGLGNSPLWDDEATTALFAESVWKTGDSNAMIDHNLVAYRSGRELVDLRNRYISPLSFYLAAPFVGLSPGSPVTARFPFALCGLATVTLMLFWLWRGRAPLDTWLLMSMAILCSASFFLFSRQCRYYSPAILLALALAYLYRRHGGRTSRLALASLVSLLLLATHALSFVAVQAVLAVDYALWTRKERTLTPANWTTYLGPLVVLGGVMSLVYNPVGKNVWGDPSSSGFGDFGWLLLWNLRELNGNEIGVGIFLAAAPVLYFWNRESLLVRGPVAVLVYIAVISAFSPQPIDEQSVASVRYLCPLLLPCFFISVLVIQTLSRSARWIAVPLAVLAFGTNVFHGGTYVDRATGFAAPDAKGGFRATIVSFIGEIINPPPSALRGAADWIARNVKAGESVLVVPDYQPYPLMFQVREPVYAWQLEEESAQFHGLPDIHFHGRVLPDHVIVFGPAITRVRAVMRAWREHGITYEEFPRLDRYWYDLTRPELIWHAFDEVRGYDPDTEAVFFFRRVRPGVPAHS
jgi:hypothetical protein